MGEHRIGQSELARRTGHSRYTLRERTNGEVDMSVTDLDLIAQVFDVNPLYLMGLMTEREPYPGDRGPDGPTTDGESVRHQGLEPRTRWFGVLAGESSLADMELDTDEWRDRDAA